MRWNPNIHNTSDRLIQRFEQFSGTISDLDQKMSFDGGALRAGIDKICTVLNKQCWSLGEPVILCLPNSPLFYCTFIAVLRFKGMPLLIHSDTPYSAILQIAKRYGVHYIMREPSAVFGQLKNDTAIRVSNIGDLLWTRLEQIESLPKPEFSGIPLHPTSGTSGQPGLVVRPGETLIAEAQHYIKTLDIKGEDVILCTTPLTHAYAFGMCFTVPFLLSAHVLTMRKFNPRLSLRGINEKHVSIMPSVPVLFDVFMRTIRGHMLMPAKVLSAGTPITATTAGRFFERSGVAIMSLYGTTETGGISVNKEPTVDNISGVGRPMEGVEVRLRPLHDNIHPRGLGVVQVKSSSMMQGYLENNRINTKSIDHGWFDTGDIAKLSKDGKIFLYGRESEFVNVFGMKVMPSEVEAAILDIKYVDQVKVYAGKSRNGKEELSVAIISSQGWKDANEIRRHCMEHLVSYKCPTSIHFMDAFPRNASGKVITQQLPNAFH